MSRHAVRLALLALFVVPLALTFSPIALAAEDTGLGPGDGKMPLSEEEEKKVAIAFERARPALSQADIEEYYESSITGLYDPALLSAIKTAHKRAIEMNNVELGRWYKTTVVPSLLPANDSSFVWPDNLPLDADASRQIMWLNDRAEDAFERAYRREGLPKKQPFKVELTYGDNFTVLRLEEWYYDASGNVMLFEKYHDLNEPHMQIVRDNMRKDPDSHYYEVFFTGTGAAQSELSAIGDGMGSEGMKEGRQRECVCGNWAERPFNTSRPMLKVRCEEETTGVSASFPGLKVDLQGQRDPIWPGEVILSIPGNPVLRYKLTCNSDGTLAAYTSFDVGKTWSDPAIHDRQ